MFQVSHDDLNPQLVERVHRVRLLAFDFDGVFTSNMVYVFEDGREAVRCTRADGLGLERLRGTGVEAIILSTEKNRVVSARAQKLRVACYQGCDDKHTRLGELLVERGLSFSQAGFVGNDTNDLDCLLAVGLPIVVQDAHPEVLHTAFYRTRNRGGEGAVREVCDLFCAVRKDNGGSRSDAHTAV